MNALLEKYLEKARQEGKEEGRKEGKEEGRKEGEEIGRAKEIIRMSRKFNIADNEILEDLRNTLQISLEGAKEILDEYETID